MLDIRFIRENTEAVRAGIRAKQLDEALASLDELLLADEEERLLRRELEEKQGRRNSASRLIGELKRKGESAEPLMREMAGLAAEVKQLEERSRSLDERIRRLLLEIPNLPDESVPYGESEHDNVVLHERGDAPEFDFAARPHWELPHFSDWVDLEAGVTLTGAGFPVFRGQGARLVRALQMFFLDRLDAPGFTEIMPPLVVNETSAFGTGQLPDKEGQMYEVDGSFYLIPTSEVSLTNLHRGEILDVQQLPVRYAGFTPCFRREAGSYGKDVRGLNRLHQFDKVEMVVFTRPEDSDAMLERITEIAEELINALGLRYRRLFMCTGDMGFTQSKKYDLEVWSAGQQRWLEVSSVSNMTDFQARRLQTRAREGGVQGKGRPELVHTLNGSALAFPRTIAALLEHYQNEDGSVTLPAVLAPWLPELTLS
jgi:seryl-tRNA synthetase